MSSGCVARLYQNGALWATLASLPSSPQIIDNHQNELVSCDSGLRNPLCIRHRARSSRIFFSLLRQSSRLPGVVSSYNTLLWEKRHCRLIHTVSKRPAVSKYLWPHPSCWGRARKLRLHNYYLERIVVNGGNQPTIQILDFVRKLMYKPSSN